MIRDLWHRDKRTPSPTDFHASMPINAYLNHQRVRGFSPRTVNRRAWSLNLWVNYLLSHDSSLGKAGPADVEGFLARWPAPQSRYSIRADVAMFYRFACKRGLLHDDPTLAVEPPKLVRRKPSAIPASAVRSLLEHIDGTDRLLIMLAAYLGLRISEIAAVRGEHYDRRTRTLRVVGKGNREDDVPVARVVADELDRYPAFGRLLPQSSGIAVGDRIRTLLRRHGIDGRPHDLRHSFATEAVDRSNGNIVLVSKLMRHAEVTTTMRYVRLDRSGHDVVDRLYGEVA